VGLADRLGGEIVGGRLAADLSRARDRRQEAPTPEDRGAAPRITSWRSWIRQRPTRREIRAAKHAPRVAAIEARGGRRSWRRLGNLHTGTLQGLFVAGARRVDRARLTARIIAEGLEALREELRPRGFPMSTPRSPRPTRPRHPGAGGLGATDRRSQQSGASSSPRPLPALVSAAVPRPLSRETYRLAVSPAVQRGFLEETRAPYGVAPEDAPGTPHPGGYRGSWRTSAARASLETACERIASRHAAGEAPGTWFRLSLSPVDRASNGGRLAVAQRIIQIGLTCAGPRPSLGFDHVTCERA